jgi:hypothetical protein
MTGAHGDMADLPIPLVPQATAFTRDVVGKLGGA